MTVTVTGEKVEIQILPRLLPFNPDLVDEDTLRSIIFLIPGCLTAVIDVPALDVERGRDHGIAAYNDLRRVQRIPRSPICGVKLGEERGARK